MAYNFLALLFWSCLIFNITTVNAVYTVVRSPIVATGAEEAAIIVVPGAYIAGEAYEPLGYALQKSTTLRLWMALTSGYRLNLVNPLSVEEAVFLAMDDLQKAGMKDGTPIFVAGHSLGGTFAQTVVNAQPGKFAGFMLWASYLNGATADLGAFPSPVLHVSGDLDGLTRMTRIGKAFRQLSTLVKSNIDTLYTKSVVLVGGVNHGQFASGDMPPEVVENDITSSLTEEQAHFSIAEVCMPYVEANIAVNADARESMRTAVARTNVTFGPLFEAQDLESNGKISGWAVYAQERVASIPDEDKTRFRITNDLYTNQEEFESSKPSVVKDLQGMTVVNTKAKVDYPLNALDNSQTEESATQIAVKMKNQQAIEDVLGSDVRYGIMLNCMEINQVVVSWALQMASEAVVDRYNTSGRQIAYREDIQAETGSQWVNSPLKYTYTIDGDLVLTSTSLYTSPNYIIPTFAGMYYCNLLSPYRAMEWIYVDSLRPYHQ